jgi:hypothetical protein
MWHVVAQGSTERQPVFQKNLLQVAPIVLQMATQPMKQPKKSVIRARCSDDLKRGVEELARLQNVDPADVIRIAVQKHIQRARDSIQLAA